MPEQPHPQDIARRSFDVVRRGFDQNAVRGFLHEVSSLVERLQRAERELRERAERAEARAEMTARPDEAAMLELLGEETTRVLTSAREAAADIRSKAEASAERLIADATAQVASVRSTAAAEADELRAAARAESDQLLEQARTELDRRSAEAQEAAERILADAESAAEALRDAGRRALEAAQEEAAAAVEAAKAEGRAMVAEAQAVRERMLRDLAVRRKKARLQVEKLNAGRERLLQAYDLVRRTVDEATDELHGALVDARAAADAAARRVEDEPEPSLEQLDAEVAEAGLGLSGAELDEGEGDDDVPPDDHDAHHDAGPSPRSGEVPAVERAPSVDEAASDAQPASNGDGDARSVTALTAERRNRRSRRRKGRDDLPGEVTKLDPPSDDEGVRVLTDIVDEGAAITSDEPSEAGAPAGAAAPAEAEAPVGEGEAPVGEAARAEAEAAAREAAPAEPPPVVGEEPEPAAPGSDAGDEAPSGSAVEEPAHDDPDAPSASADEVFAKLRADATEPEPGEPAPEPADAAEGHAGAEPEHTEAVEPAAAHDGAAAADQDDVAEEAAAEDAAAAPFRARDEALAPNEKELARRLKRALADEQNEVLDLLRREEPKGVDDLLPDHDAHVARWATVVEETLAEGAAAGASWAGGSPGTVIDLSTELARALVEPLRDRIDRSFAASDGNLDDVADRVRALYREWKGQRLTESAAHYAVAAYAHGSFDALRKRSSVRWVVDPAAGPCPDCDDNTLAGTITKGEPFPTGTRCAPAHPGCRCLVVAG